MESRKTQIDYFKLNFIYKNGIQIFITYPQVDSLKNHHQQ